MPGPQKIVFKGKVIFFADHKGSKGDEVVKNQQKMLDMIKESGMTDCLNLTDMTDVVATNEVHQQMKKIGEEILKHSKKGAVVGMAHGIKNVLISSFMRLSSKPMRLFESLEEAKEWLVSD
jgi:hypothetical protein